MPPTIIPQTVEQANQRDSAHGHTTSPQPAPEQQLATLKQAIRHHQAEIEAAGPLAPADQLTEHQTAIMDRKHQADQTLWATLRT